MCRDTKKLYLQGPRGPLPNFFLLRYWILVFFLPNPNVESSFISSSCQYGARCKFLHASQQNSKPNAFGFGTQSDSQFQRANSQQQKPNPFGFGVQNNSQPRGFSDFGSKQNQAKVLCLILYYLCHLVECTCFFFAFS